MAANTSSGESTFLPMPINDIRKAQVTYPTGNPNFAVQQAFPAAFSETDCDPFLMMDHFGPTVSKGVETDPDKFPVDWHPHRGIDILTYIIKGNGRHADSLGNRETFKSPGMQWISVGSGIEHAEGGGTPKGEIEEGFQIWVNVPREHKMDDPRYGTEPPENLPMIDRDGVKARVMAGIVENLKGPFKTVQDVQMIDFTIAKDKSYAHVIPENYGTCLIYVYSGTAKINGSIVKKNFIIKLDALSMNPAEKMAIIHAVEDMSCILFAGVRLNQPIAWHGPFVMNTEKEIRQAMIEYQRGTFLRKRAKWDYQRAAAKPEEASFERDASHCL